MLSRRGIDSWRRLSGRYSINHPIAVANLLSSTGITDVRVLQAALLHDTVEDTDTTLGEYRSAS